MAAWLLPFTELFVFLGGLESNQYSGSTEK